MSGLKYTATELEVLSSTLETSGLEANEFACQAIVSNNEFNTSVKESKTVQSLQKHDSDM